MRTVILFAIAIACSPVRAEEPLRWQIVGPALSQEFRQLSSPWTVVGSCDCLVPGDCPCGPGCACRPEAAKPTVLAYKDFRITCPGCIQLERQADALPVRLEWRQAPPWVPSFPTLHWRGDDGRWYQYQWGRRDDDVAAFRRAWETTVRADEPHLQPNATSSTSAWSVHD